MKRKAILIESSNVIGQSELPGAKIDVENWRNFLTSEIGGNWNSSDIVTLRKPTSSDVRSALNLNEDCYCFVAFSGHGSEGSVVLNDYWDKFPIGNLQPKTEKGTLIVDSCRGLAGDAERAIKSASAVGPIDEQVVANMHSGRVMIFNASARGKTVYLSGRSSYSDHWEESLRHSNRGIVTMQSCAKGQSALENPAAGGYYTSLLMQAAENFSASNSPGKVQSTKQAHEYATKALPPQQTPEYSPSNIQFPFAVSL